MSPKEAVAALEVRRGTKDREVLDAWLKRSAEAAADPVQKALLVLAAKGLRFANQGRRKP